MNEKIKIDRFNYKKIKVLAPFCPICDKQVRGDGSIVNPYHCDCGDWEIEMDDKDWHYVLIKK